MTPADGRSSSVHEGDATELHAAQAALAAERQRLFTSLDELPLLAVVAEESGAVRFSNRCFRERLDSPSRVPWDVAVGERRDWAAPDGRCYEVAVHPFLDAGDARLTLAFGLDVSAHRLARE